MYDIELSGHQVVITLTMWSLGVHQTVTKLSSSLSLAHNFLRILDVAKQMLPCIRSDGKVQDTFKNTQ